MAVDYKFEKNENGTMSFSMEDNDGSGDLDRLFSEIAKQKVAEHKAKELLQPLSEEDETQLDAELDKYDLG
jgi:hypothetical protein